MSVPIPGWTSECEILDNHDGDTVTVRITRIMKIRLLNCWAPELNEPGGKESRDNLKQLIAASKAKGEKGTIHVPLVQARDGTFNPAESTSFTRVLGELYAGELNVGAAQVRAGHAKETK